MTRLITHLETEQILVFGVFQLHKSSEGGMSEYGQYNLWQVHSKFKSSREKRLKILSKFSPITSYKFWVDMIKQLVMKLAHKKKKGKTQKTKTAKKKCEIKQYPNYKYIVLQWTGCSPFFGFCKILQKPWQWQNVVREKSWDSEKAEIKNWKPKKKKPNRRH